MGLEAAAALGALGSLYQLGTGIQQGIRGRRLGRAERPWYNIPTEISKNADLAKNAYGASTLYGLPGQGAITSANDRATAGAMRGMNESQQSPASLLAGYAALDQNSKNSNANLGVQAAQYRANQMNATRGQLMGANRVLAQYKDQAFNNNYMEPYNNKMNASAALRQSAITNTFGAINNLGSAAGQYWLRKGDKTPTEGTMTGSIGQEGTSFGNPIGGGLKSATQIATGDQNQFPDLYGQNSAVKMMELRKTYPYNTMTDEEFYRSVGDSGGVPFNNDISTPRIRY